MRIGEVAAAAGVSTRALRYYEQQRLLPALRSTSGQRHYPEEAVDRVRLIQALYAAGLGSRAIVDLLPCVHTGVATPEMIEHLHAERDRIDARVKELATTRDRLDAVIDAATHPEEHCSPTATASAPGVTAPVTQAQQPRQRTS